MCRALGAARHNGRVAPATDCKDDDVRQAEGERGDCHHGPGRPQEGAVVVTGPEKQTDGAGNEGLLETKQSHQATTGR